MPNEFCCKDCKADTSSLNEYYMVHDHIWLATGLSKQGGMLCLGCLEGRIGRRLCANDFSDYPINHGFFRRSERFLDRLQAAPAAAQIKQPISEDAA